MSVIALSHNFFSNLIIDSMHGQWTRNGSSIGNITRDNFEELNRFGMVAFFEHLEAMNLKYHLYDHSQEFEGETSGRSDWSPVEDALFTQFTQNREKRLTLNLRPVNIWQYFQALQCLSYNLPISSRYASRTGYEGKPITYLSIKNTYISMPVSEVEVTCLVLLDKLIQQLKQVLIKVYTPINILPWGDPYSVSSESVNESVKEFNQLMSEVEPSSNEFYGKRAGIEQKLKAQR